MKKPDSYLFTSSSNHYKSLDHVVITRDVNKVMREVFNQLPDKPNITSHIFRIGYIIYYPVIEKISSLLDKPSAIET